MKNDPGPNRSTVALEMRRAVQAVQRWSVRTLHRGTGTSLSPIETHLLNRLATAPPQRMSDLANWQGVDRSTMTTQITRLADRGLVRRVPDPRDRRASLIELTDDGGVVLDDYLEKAAALLGETLCGWSDEDLTRFGTDLRRFTDDLEHALVKSQMQ